MKLAAVCLAALLLAAGCSNKPEAPQAAATSTPTAGAVAATPSSSATTDAPPPLPTSSATPTPAAKPAEPFNLLIEIVGPPDPKIVVMSEPMAFPKLVEVLTDLRREYDIKNIKLNVIVRADPEGAYEDFARVLLACGKAGIASLTFNDFPLRLPPHGLVDLRFGIEEYDRIQTPARPPAGVSVPRINVELLDENDARDVKIIFEDDQELGMDFGALRRKLTEMWAGKIAPDTVLVLKPTMAARCKYVLQALLAGHDAGFTDIRFAVPYE